MLGIFLDQETTGLDSTKHRVIEIGLRVIDLQTGEVISSFSSVVKQPQKVWDERDPASIKVNGFTWEEILNGRDEKEIGEIIIKKLKEAGIVRGKSVFICQNPSFDRPFFSHFVDTYTQEKLNWPYHWLDLASMFWALEVKSCHDSKLEVPNEQRLSKNAIAKTLGLPPEAHPHKAMQGVDHLIICYEKSVGFPK